MKAKACVVAVLLGALALPVPSQPAKTKGMVIIRNSIVIPDTGEAALPKLAEGQVLPCLRVLENGFLIGCYDAEQKPRVAFLPLRDEWGHLSARARMYDPASTSNTVQILNPFPLKPGWIPLEKGATYPVVTSDAKGHTILISFAGFNREVVVSGTDAELLPPPKPETDPVKLREQELARLLEKSTAELTELRQNLDTVKVRAERLMSLTRDLATNELEKNRIKMEIVRAEGICKELLTATPATQQAAVTALLGETQKLAQKQADLDAGIRRMAIDIEPVKALRKQLAALEGDIEKLQAAALARNAELEALRKGEIREDVKQDRETVRNLLDGLAKQNADLVTRIQQLELGATSLKTLVEKLDALQQENVRLQAQLQALTAELQDLQKKIQDLQKPAAPEPEKKEQV